MFCKYLTTLGTTFRKCYKIEKYMQFACNIQYFWFLLIIFLYCLNKENNNYLMSFIFTYILKSKYTHTEKHLNFDHYLD